MIFTSISHIAFLLASAYPVDSAPTIRLDSNGLARLSRSISIGSHGSDVLLNLVRRPIYLKKNDGKSPLMFALQPSSGDTLLGLATSPITGENRSAMYSSLSDVIEGGSDSINLQFAMGGLFDDIAGAINPMTPEQASAINQNLGLFTQLAPIASMVLAINGTGNQKSLNLVGAASVLGNAIVGKGNSGAVEKAIPYIEHIAVAASLVEVIKDFGGKIDTIQKFADEVQQKSAKLPALDPAKKDDPSGDPARIDVANQFLSLMNAADSFYLVDVKAMQQKLLAKSNDSMFTKVARDRFTDLSNRCINLIEVWTRFRAGQIAIWKQSVQGFIGAATPTSGSGTASGQG